MSVFLDTNILLCSLDLNAGEGTRHDVALGYLARRDVVLSVQVLQEFYVQATHARRARPVSHDDAVGLIRAWSRFEVVDNSQASSRRAWRCVHPRSCRSGMLSSLRLPLAPAAKN